MPRPTGSAGADDRGQLGGAADHRHRRRARLPPEACASGSTGFNAEGLDRLGPTAPGGPQAAADRGRARRIIALARSTPPGRLARRTTAGDRCRSTPTPAAEHAGAVDPGQPSPPPPARGASASPAARSAGSCSAERGALAPHPLLDHQPRSGLRPKRTRIIGLYTLRRQGTTVICADELGPVIPRTFPPRPAGRPTGTGSRPRWSTAAARRRPGCTAACASATAARSPSPPPPATAPATSASAQLEQANPAGPIVVITDNLSSHNSWLHPPMARRHPRIRRCSSRSKALLAEPAGGLVADLPQRPRSPGRPSPTPTRSPTPPRRHRPAQRPRPALDLGTPITQPRRPRAASSSTCFEERSTRRSVGREFALQAE